MFVAKRNFSQNLFKVGFDGNNYDLVRYRVSLGDCYIALLSVTVREYFYIEIKNSNKRSSNAPSLFVGVTFGKAGVTVCKVE